MALFSDIYGSIKSNIFLNRKYNFKMIEQTMSKTEENIESALKENHSLWDKFKINWVNDYSKFIISIYRVNILGK
jgi:hypothetical protein